jgi:hypothetical protein
MPDNPAPTMTTSKCSVGMAFSRKPLSDRQQRQSIAKTGR